MVQRLIRAAAPFFAAFVAASRLAVAQSGPVPSVARQALVPRRRLRAALIVSKPVLVQRAPATGQLSRGAVELATALARQLGVPLEPVCFANPRQLSREPIKQDPLEPRLSELVAILRQPPTRARLAEADVRSLEARGAVSGL